MNIPCVEVHQIFHAFAMVHLFSVLEDGEDTESQMVEKDAIATYWFSLSATSSWWSSHTLGSLNINDEAMNDYIR